MLLYVVMRYINLYLRGRKMFEYEKTIPFYDVDPMRVAWHGNYIKYLEEARCAYLAEKGMTYSDMQKLGYAFPIVELKVKYIRPCTFGQQIIIKTEVTAAENFIIFNYEIIDKATKTKICKAETKQMCVDLSTNESLFVIPECVAKRLK